MCERKCSDCRVLVFPKNRESFLGVVKEVVNGNLIIMNIQGEENSYSPKTQMFCSGKKKNFDGFLQEWTGKKE